MDTTPTQSDRMPLDERLLLRTKRQVEKEMWAHAHGYGGSALLNSDIEDNLVLADLLEARGGWPRLWGVEKGFGHDCYLIWEDWLAGTEIKSSFTGIFSFGHKNRLPTLVRMINSPTLYNVKHRVKGTDRIEHEVWVVFPTSPIHTMFLREWVRVVKGRPHLKLDGTRAKTQEQKMLVRIGDVRRHGVLLIDQRTKRPRAKRRTKQRV